MTHPTRTAENSAAPPPRGVGMGVGGFPLATLAARVMLGVSLFFTLLTAVPWFFTRGPEVALGVAVSALPILLILAAFALLLPRGIRMLAAVFALWCAWGLIDSLSGGRGLLSSLVGHAYGVLNFGGIVGVLKGWQTRTPA